MSDSTSILDLPTDPVGGGNVSNNISMAATENVVVSQNQLSTQQLNGNLDETTISQIVSGLQTASRNGSTQLPSRDISMNTTSITNDPYIQTNYVPPPPPQQNVDYIRNYEQTSDMIDDYNKNMRNSNSLDDMYNEIQVPLLLAVLYFLFQLPFSRKFLFSYFPILFSTDGNMNINGFLFTSILFGLLYYLLNKITTHFGAF